MNKSEKFWDKVANRSDKQVNKIDPTYIKTVENTKKHLNINDVVLDYACGTGSITIEIVDHVKEIHAIDLSSKMIEVARRKAGEHKIENINYQQSTIFDEMYKKESFNVILAFNILHLLEDTQQVMQRINELLKPEGLFISATPCMGAFLGILLSLLRKIGIVPYTKSFKISELENLVANGNFQIVETESLSHTPLNYFIVAKKLLRT